jgi:hypothetical protein
MAKRDGAGSRVRASRPERRRWTSGRDKASGRAGMRPPPRAQEPGEADMATCDLPSALPPEVPMARLLK